MSIIFDVGANDGSSTIEFAKKDINNTVYAFEANPELCRLIENKTVELPNFKVFPKAVSDFNGVAKFNIAPRHGAGCSSLFDYSPHMGEIWKGLKHRFEVAETIQVEVITMEKFIEENNVSVIDYFHCDAQGADLKVLKSFGKYIDLLREGVVESSRAPETSTYEVDNTFGSLNRFLVEHNFEIMKTESDKRRNEMNVYFRRRS